MILDIKRIIEDLKLNNFKQTAKLSVLALMLTTALVSPNTPVLAETPKAKFALKLDSSTHAVFASQNTKINIVVGESIKDQQIRVEKEKAIEAQKRIEVVARERSSVVLPENMDLTNVYKQVGANYGIPWKYIKSIHYIETGCAVNQKKLSSAGARGPMQFLPSTWRHYGVDGDGDGVKNIDNVIDAINGAANYLRASGGQTDIRKALYSYNPSTSYVNKVSRVAESIAD